MSKTDIPKSSRANRPLGFFDRVRRNLPGNGHHHGSTHEYSVPRKHDDQVRLITLNMAHGRRRGPHQALQPRGRLESNVHQLASLLAESLPDVVALQEADGPSVWSGNFDHVARLAKLANLPHHYRGDHSYPGVGRWNLQYGTALMSRHPLSGAESHSFRETWRDTKGFVVATVPIPQWNGEEIDVVSLHLDFLAPKVRRRQIRRLAKVLSERKHPLVLLGDFNCHWHQEPRTLELITKELGLRAYEPDSHRPTFPAIRPIRRLDWVLITEELDFGHQHLTLPHWVSDHLPVVADLELRKR